MWIYYCSGTDGINNTLYFKVINSIGGYHDELWTSKGDAGSTQIIKTFDVGRATFSILAFMINYILQNTIPCMEQNPGNLMALLQEPPC
jgi:hypothetical protein